MPDRELLVSTRFNVSSPKPTLETFQTHAVRALPLPVPTRIQACDTDNVNPVVEPFQIQPSRMGSNSDVLRRQHETRFSRFVLIPAFTISHIFVQYCIRMRVVQTMAELFTYSTVLSSAVYPKNPSYNNHNSSGMHTVSSWHV